MFCTYENIDLIDALICFSHITYYRKEDIHLAMHRIMLRLLSNMNDDRGFAFKRNEGFMYGHKRMYLGINESSMFSTWFRTLCLVYLIEYFNKEIRFKFVKYFGLKVLL